MNLLCFLGFLGKNSRAYNLAYTSRLNYVHAGLFVRAYDLVQKP